MKNPPIVSFEKYNSAKIHRCCNLVVPVSLFFVLQFMITIYAFGEENPPVWKYAKKCFERIELADPKDLEGPFSCEDGIRLPVTIKGHIGDINVCTGSHCLTDFPDEATGCDKPAWLPGDQQCYGNSFVQLIRPESNKDIRVALLCRHNKNWTDNTRRFDDIAMIAFNEKNGETCWFQSQLGDIFVRNGKRVKGPATVRSHLFWMRPKKAMEIGCIACHDSGPFVVSPWIRHAFKDTGFFDTNKGLYRNSEPPFNRWPEPKYIDIGTFGLQGDHKPCTACHKIAAGGLADSNGNGVIDSADRPWMTCGQWIKWSSTKQWDVTASNDTYKTEPVYMPPRTVSRKNGYLALGHEWNSAYKKHVKQLSKCCAQLGNDSTNTDENCKLK